MSCLLCASANQGEFGTEILVHFPGLKNLDTPPVWVYPKLPVLSGLRFFGVYHPEKELAILAGGTPTIEAQSVERSNVL